MTTSIDLLRASAFGTESPPLHHELPDGSTTYVGQGINVLTATGPNVESMKPSLLIPDVYKSESAIEISPIIDSERSSQASDDLTEVFQSEEISAQLKTNADLAFFSGGISVKYGSSAKLNKTARFYSSVASVETVKHSLESSYRMRDELRKIVNPVVLSYIDNSTIAPDELFEAYGTHLIREASLGGCIQFNSIYMSEQNITTSDYQMAMDLACSYVSADAHGKATQEQQRMISSSSIHCKSYGGDIAIAASMNTFEEIAESFKEWSNSIRDKKNQVLAFIYDYYPIWELALDPTRRNDIKQAFIEMGGEKYTAVERYFQKPSLIALYTSIINKKGDTLIHYVKSNTRAQYLVGEVLPGPNVAVIYERTFFPDGTVCFRSVKTNGYVTVFPDSDGVDRSHLYPQSTNLSDQQLFRLEKIGQLFRILSCHTEMYITTHEVPHTHEVYCFAADGDKESAPLFGFYRI